MSDPTKPDFRVLSRKPFEGELPIIEAVRKARTQLVTSRDLVAGSALFRIHSQMTTTNLIPQAVDIVRGIEKAVVDQNAIVRSVRTYDAAPVQLVEKIQSGIENARADIAASLARLNA